MELHKPDLMRKDNETQGRDKEERTAKAFLQSEQWGWG